MLKALNLDNSTNLASPKTRNKVTINYQIRHGFTNLFNNYSENIKKYKEADATIFVTQYSTRGTKGTVIIKRSKSFKFIFKTT